MKKIVGIFFFAASFYSIGYSQCPNANFSAGSISGNWSGTTGTYSATNGVYGATGGMVLGTTNENTYASDMGRQTLITASQTDPETGNALNELPPSGGYCVRLGNPRTASCDGGDAQEEQLSYTYTPTATSCIFTYQYAVVLHDPGTSASHTQYTRPSFVIQILSSSGALIDSACGYYSVTAVAGIPGFVQCSPDPNDACDNTDDVLWKDWTSVSVDLTTQIGNNVTINFATRDCNPSGHAGKHFGYAYLTCNCGSFTLAQQCTGTSDSVTAPAGYAVYDWSYKNTSGTIVNTNTGTANTITINPVPNGDTITCVCTSVTGCQFQYKLPLSINVPVFTPAAPTICAGTTANITASGIGTYTYQWSTGASGASISVTPPRDTTYSVTATAPGGCSSSASVPVTVNPLPAGSTTSTPATCGNDNGTITVNLTTGTLPYTYDWGTTPVQNTVTASNLGAGSYIVTVTDANSCSATITGAITSPSGITLAASSTPEYCGHSNGTATAIATGGSGPLSYTWSTVPPQTTATATGLSGGNTYTVTVTDGVCPVTASVSITDVAGPSVHIDSLKNETCSLGNGSAIISAFGGTPPFTYAWSGTTQTTPIITGLSAGTYSVTITDSNNCTANNSLVIKNFPPPIVQMSFSPSTCNLPNGWVAVAVSSGTPPFTYTWNPSGPNADSVLNITGGVIYSITVTDSTGCVATTSSSVPNLPGPVVNGITVSESCVGMNNGSINTIITDPASPYTFKWSNNDSTQNISNLPGGVTYTVTVTDAAGCTNTASFVVGTHPIINLALSSNDSHCNQSDGSIELVVTGGTPPTFTYTWSNSATTQNLNNIMAGTYTVTVTDGFCTSTGTDSLISLPGPTVSIPNKKDETCSASNGSATALPAGGATPIQYSWSTTPVQTDSTATGLHAGTYIVTIKDANGCTASSSVVILNSPPPTAFLLNTVPANCGFTNGEANINVFGGTLPLTYNWNTSPVQTTQDASSVPSGSYLVTVTDSNSCTATVQVVVGQLAGPSVVVSGEPEICSRNNGSAIATASGGHGAPYTYTWSNGQITQKDTGLGGQTYTVTISDGGCTASNSVNIYNIPGPSAYFLYSPKVLNILDGPVYFQDQSTGTVINWEWSLGDGDTASGTPFWHQYHAIGTYPVIEVVTDTNGCKDTIVDTVLVKDIFTFYIPNAFTPNNGGLNVLFSPQGSNVDPNNFNEYIYDRWGNLVFHTNEWDLTKPPSGQAKGWNGTVNNSGSYKNVVMDVYVYKIVLREFNDGPEHEYIGSITLVP